MELITIVKNYLWMLSCLIGNENFNQTLLIKQKAELS